MNDIYSTKVSSDDVNASAEAPFILEAAAFRVVIMNAKSEQENPYQLIILTMFSI